VNLLAQAVDYATTHMPQILAFLGGFLTALFAEPLRLWLFRARVTLEFLNADHFVTSTSEQGGHQAKYVRIKAVNHSGRLAKNCRAYLTNIERRGPSGAWEATEYCESMQLGWSARGDGAHTALDLPKDVPCFIDVLSTRSISTNFLPSTQWISSALRTPSQFAGHFSFHGPPLRGERRTGPYSTFVQLVGQLERLSSGAGISPCGLTNRRCSVAPTVRVSVSPRRAAERQSSAGQDNIATIRNNASR
jgi:hypothetical protein